MRGPVLARAREGLRIVVFSALFALLALVANTLVMAIFVIAAGSFHDAVPPFSPADVDDLAGKLVLEGGAYRLPDEAIEGLRDRGQWAMLIDDGGEVVWELDLPADVPTSYTMADVASFTRWYLNDYPVVTRMHGDGLLVVGSPKGSAWKYSYSTNMSSVTLSLALLVALLLANMVVAIMVARAYARRSWAERDHARREWIAAVSHDVRTPLTVAMAEADTLARDEGLGVEQRRRADHVVGKVSEVAALVTDLNAANRLSYAMEPVEAEPVALAPVVRSVAAEAINDDSEGTHPVEIELAEDAEDLRVRGDAALFRRMLANLVRNSARHNPDGCTVRISLGRASRHLFRKPRCLLVVEDDGRGLGADMLQTLRRAPSGELPEHGLGLVIVRRIAAACGGTARFSDAEGGGTRCEVELPSA